MADKSPARPALSSSDPSPRFTSVWLGCDLLSWLRLLGPNWRRLDRTRWRMMCACTFASPINSLLGLLQQMVFGLAVRRTRLVEDPLFIVGHWRSGTTILHHLLALDKRFTFLNNYVCFAPHHFLLTEWLLREGFDWLAPPTRPIDTLPLQSTGPQEDEFALLSIGAPSPYAAIAFPNEGLDLAARVDREQEELSCAKRWQRKMDWLVRALTFRERKRVVLKSPTHTYRMRRLLEMYPNAQFVHIKRDPADTIASTLAMWRSLCRTQSLAPLDDSRLEDSVLSNYHAMCRSLDAVGALLGPSQLHVVEYERLLQDPYDEMKSLYAALELGKFDCARPEVLRHLRAIKDHHPTDHDMSAGIASGMRDGAYEIDGD